MTALTLGTLESKLASGVKLADAKTRALVDELGGLDAFKQRVLEVGRNHPDDCRRVSLPDEDSGKPVQLFFTLKRSGDLVAGIWQS